MAPKTQAELIWGLGQALWNTGIPALQQKARQVMDAAARQILPLVPDVTTKATKTPARVIPSPTAAAVQRAQQTQSQLRRQALNEKFGPAAPRPRGFEAPSIAPRPVVRTPAVPARQSMEGTQLRLPVAARKEGYGVPRGKGAPSPEYTQAVERARLGMQEAMPDVPAQRFAGTSPGQLGLDSLAIAEPTGPLGRSLLASDPQTYKSVSDMAVRASQQYGVPVSAEDLLGSRGTAILRSLEFPSDIVRRPGTSVARVDSADLAYAGGNRGALVRSPGGAVVGQPTRALPGGEPAIDVQWRTLGGPLGEVAARPPAGAGFNNAVGGLRAVDLSGGGSSGVGGKGFTPIEILRAGVPIGAGAAVLGLAVNGDQARYFNPETGEEVTQEGLLTSGGGAPTIPPQDTFNRGTQLPDLTRGAGATVGPEVFDRPVAPQQRVPGAAPAAPVLPPPPGQLGSGQVVIRMNDADSVQRQAAANAAAGTTTFQPTPGSYTNARDYYAARAGYVAQPGVMSNVTEQLVQQSPRMGDADMQAWAKANPALAYQLLQDSLPRGHSQQTQNIQDAEITTELGTNTANNVVGNTNEAVATAAGASPDLKAATDPNLRVSLKAMPRDMQAFYNRTGSRFANVSYR